MNLWGHAVAMGQELRYGQKLMWKWDEIYITVAIYRYYLYVAVA